MRKSAMAGAAVLLSVGIITGCQAGTTSPNQNQNQTTGGAARTAQTINLVQWTYYQPAQLAAQQFEKLHPNIHITVKVFPGDQYETKLQQALSTNTDVPDIFDMDAGYIGKFLDTPYVTNLSALGMDKIVANDVPYVAALGKNSKGQVVAVTDTSSPGGFWYNRAAAKKWLGTDDPNKVSALVSSWPKLVAEGKLVASKSKGKVHLLDTDGSVMAVEEYHMDHFVQNNKLVIDPRWNLALNYMRQIHNTPGVEANLGTFSAGWGAAINDHSANPQAILFAVPSWASFMVDQSKGKANGKYGIAMAPAGYYEGGRYAAIYSQSPNKQAAYQFLQYLQSSQWENWDLKNTANMPALQTVFKSNMNTYTIPMFGNQKVLQMYDKIAMDLPPHAPDQYNEDIISMMGSISAQMLNKNQTNQWAFSQLKSQVKAAYPNVNVQ